MTPHPPEIDGRQTMSTAEERIKGLTARLRSTLPVCPYDPKSPDYYTAPDDKPCYVCGQENDDKAPIVCRGCDTRCMAEAATELETLLSDKEALEREREEWRARHARAVAAGGAELLNARDLESALTAAQERVGELVEGIKLLENACEQLASERSLKTYDSMLEDGSANTLIALDNARRSARALTTPKTPAGQEDGVES